MAVLTSQGTQEWYTPAHVIAWVREILGGIELDPASCEEANKIVQAERFFSEQDDGFSKQWHAKTLFLNPPFDSTAKWLAKLEYQFHERRVKQAIMLVNSAPGYVWYEKMWRRYTVCCLRERLCFVSSDGNTYGQAKKGQTLVYFGYLENRFSRVLESHGRVFAP